MIDIIFTLILAASALNGIAVGASLDQAIKQLLARHRSGVVAYSRYSQAADLGNGIPWYVSVGIGAVVLTLGAALAAFVQASSLERMWPLYLAALLSLLHSLVTTQAAPTLFRQRHHPQDVAALTILFNRFARLHTLRALLQVLTLAALLGALLLYPR